MNPIPFQVFGINLLVRLMPEPPADVRIHCPKGSPIRYGEVTGRGDGFDEGAGLAFSEGKIEFSVSQSSVGKGQGRAS